MRKIIKVKVQKMKSKDGKDYILSTATLDDGSEATGVGTFEVGETVRYWFDAKYNRIKMAHIKQAGNVLVGLLCLIGLVVLVLGAWWLVQVVRDTYKVNAQDFPGFTGSGMNSASTTLKQEIKPLELKGSPDHNIQPATNYIQPMRSTK